MKNILFIILICSSTCAFSQRDTIVMNDKSKVGCFIKAVKKDKIYYCFKNDSITAWGFFFLDSIRRYKYNEVWTQVALFKDGERNQIVNVKIQDELIYMRKNLKHYNDWYYGSYLMLLAGAGFTIYGLNNKTSQDTVYTSPTTYTVEKKPVPVALYAAGVCGAASLIMQLYCHHFIGRAGIGIAGKGVVVRYTF